MIEKFRKASESWIVRGLFLFMAVAFALMWGGGDIIGRSGSGQQTVVTVGKRKITSWEFSEHLNRQIAQIQMRTGQVIDEEKARQAGLFNTVRDRMVNETLLSLEAERLGIQVSDDFIRHVIINDKTFSGEDGKFDKKRFDYLISKIGFDEKKYIEILRGDLIRERLIDTLSSGVNVPLTMTIPLYKWQHETRQISTVVINSQKIHIAKKPTLEQLKAFFQENMNKFKAPEYRDVTALIIDQASFIPDIKIDADALKTAYENRQSEFGDKTFDEVKKQIQEDLKKQQASEKMQKTISAIEDALGAGSTLEEIAQKNNLDLKSYKFLDAQGNTDPFTAEEISIKPEILNALDQAVLKEAFALESNISSGLIDGGDGRYFVAHVHKILPAHARTYEHVEKKIADVWIKAEQIKQAQARAQQLIDEVSRNTPLVIAAGKMKLKPIGCKISREGPVAPSVLKLTPPAIERLFETAKGTATAFGYGQTEQGVEIMVAMINSIERPDIRKVDAEELKKMQGMVKNAISNDIITEYLFSLRKRFPVEVNKRFFAKDK